MSGESLSVAFLRELQVLRSRSDSLQQDLSNLEATVSRVVAHQEDRIQELECGVNPFGNAGEAICNWLDFDEAE